MVTTSGQDDEQVLRARGERLTAQRRLILDIVRDAPGHVAVDEVLDEARRRDASINQATVYRILSWLTGQGITCVTDLGGAGQVYEYLGNPRHHHLVCQVCHCEIEVPFGLTDPLIEAIRKHYGFAARIDHLAIFGTCQACLAAAHPGDPHHAD